MGDLQRSLAIMLGENGCDVGLLKDANSDPVDRMTLMFSSMDKTILRQYECGAEPVVLLSKFFQLDVPTSHLALVHIRARIAQLRQPKFQMYADISHSPMEILTGRRKTETVLSDDVIEREDHGPVEAMHRCVAKFRSEFADDLEVRAGLATRDEDNPLLLIPKKELSSDLAISCLLHPLVGGKNFTVLLSTMIQNANTCLFKLSSIHR
jgi:hypothetical protein